MTISVISVSSDSSEDSVGTPAGRVILFGIIPTTIPDTTPVITPPIPQTDTIEIPIIAPTIPPSPDYTLASPDYSPASEIESDPSEDPSSDHIPPLPAISPFLSSADDTINSDTPDTPPSPTYDYFSLDDSVRDSSLDSSSEASLDFHLDASSNSSSRHLLSNHSSPDLQSTFARPSRKRRRSPVTSVPALPPGKINECFAYVDALRDRGIDARVVVEVIDRVESETCARAPVEVRVERVMHPVMPDDIPKPAREGAVEVTYETLGDLVQRFYDHTEAILVHRIQVIEGRGITRGLEAPKMPNTQSRASKTHGEIEDLIARRVAEEMEAREAAMNLEPLNENGDEQEGRNGNGGNGGNRGNGNGGNGGNGNRENEENGNGGNGEKKWKMGEIHRRLQRRSIAQGNVIVAEPTKLQDAIRIANNLMDQKLKGYARNAKNKRRLENNRRDNRRQQL
ncbi:hypothetical protein Tco_1483980 [Tanacetum coccineum]